MFYAENQDMMWFIVRAYRMWPPVNGPVWRCGAVDCFLKIPKAGRFLPVWPMSCPKTGALLLPWTWMGDVFGHWTAPDFDGEA